MNRKLEGTCPPVAGDDEDLALIARCWPQLDDDPLPRVVQRNGQAMFDEGWEVVDEAPAGTTDEAA